MIESTLVGFVVNGGTDADDRVSIGARLHGVALPAVVISITKGERGALGNTTNVTMRYEVTLSAIADTMADAITLEEQAFDAIRGVGLVNVPVVVAIRTSFGALEEPAIGEGDEQNPAICTSQLEIYTELYL
jgi:hypothetical protein